MHPTVVSVSSGMEDESAREGDAEEAAAEVEKTVDHVVEGNQDDRTTQAVSEELAEILASIEHKLSKEPYAAPVTVVERSEDEQTTYEFARKRGP